MAHIQAPESPGQRNLEEIARLNDGLRASPTAPGHNRVVMTQGIAALIGDMSRYAGFHRHAELLRIVRDYEDFSPDNDPYGEHDLGVFDFEGVRCYWKIDYYDATLTGGSEDPSDAAATVRVLTILLADEY